MSWCRPQRKLWHCGEIVEKQFRFPEVSQVFTLLFCARKYRMPKRATFVVRVQKSSLILRSTTLFSLCFDKMNTWRGTLSSILNLKMDRYFQIHNFVLSSVSGSRDLKVANFEKKKLYRLSSAKSCILPVRLKNCRLSDVHSEISLLFRLPRSDNPRHFGRIRSRPRFVRGFSPAWHL